VKLPDNAPSELTSHQASNSASAAKAVARPAQSKAKAKVRPHAKTGAKRATAKRVIKRHQTKGVESKQDRVIAMLRRREGATLAALVKATSWQPHSIRGFLAGTIRKKLKLSLISEKLDGVRTYRIRTGKTAEKTKVARARSA
jgi:Protein of unknown function (DUF3489)